MSLCLLFVSNSMDIYAYAFGIVLNAFVKDSGLYHFYQFMQEDEMLNIGKTNIAIKKYTKIRFCANNFIKLENNEKNS